jgi:hypothetical protein
MPRYLTTWSDKEKDILIELYSTAETQEEIEDALPGKRWYQITGKAYRMGLKLSPAILKTKRHGGCWGVETPQSRASFKAHNRAMQEKYGFFCEVCGDWMAEKDEGICSECVKEIA